MPAAVISWNRILLMVFQTASWPELFRFSLNIISRRPAARPQMREIPILLASELVVFF